MSYATYKQAIKLDNSARKPPNWRQIKHNWKLRRGEPHSFFEINFFFKPSAPQG